jgi:site-specific recombinase XerC
MRLRIAAGAEDSAVPVEPDLTPYIDGWLQVHRKTLQSTARAKSAVMGNHLWLDRWGRPMSSRAIRQQIETHTKQAFGNAIWPHLVRDRARRYRPEEIGIAPDCSAS